MPRSLPSNPPGCYPTLPPNLMPQRQPTLRIAIDTGGTFTDCVWIEKGRTRLLKVFSTPADPAQAIAEAIQQIAPDATVTLLHGTTVGTNTILQRKGARVALVTTKGFEDAIEIGRQARPKLYDFFFEKIEPLVPANLRFGIAERTDSEGKILEQPTSQELAHLAEEIRAQHPDAIAITLLFSFANTTNELAVEKTLQALSIPLSVSHKILREFREYERTSTVVVNAYLQPVMQRYLESLDQRLATRAASNPNRIFVMQSSGGITTLETAARQPVRTVLSGPAGGVVGASATARLSGLRQIISFDMGGTSTDVALVDGDAKASSQSEIAGLPVGVPMLDIHTVGAGGGSLARFDAAGALRVGPESAGADPGPICYGRGTLPTVTDANLLLGRLQPDRFLGGNFQLDLERTRQLTLEWLKKQNVTLSLERFAAGVIRVVNATMEKAIRVVSIERGYDPRHFALVAFGGAGGLHACELAQSLGIPRVVVPALPGALSAFGILVSDVIKDYSRTVLWRITADLPMSKLKREFQQLSQNASHDFHSEGWKGKIHKQFNIDTRYRGQGYELSIPFSPKLIADFHRAHAQRYGYSHPDREIELVTLRLRATMKFPPIKLTTRSKSRSETPSQSNSRTQIEQRRVIFDGKSQPSRIYERDQLTPGKKYPGPAVVTEYSATTIIPPQVRFSIDRASNLLIDAR
ncbi:MAG TPA: hydantoinase/oxoprolinase family protein [Terriglobales bacterium]|nr:hydantoinase/oxoprolinase family protein [Terriglobales bacterium]